MLTPSVKDIDMDTQDKQPQTTLPSLTGNYVFDDLLSGRERRYLVEHGHVRSLEVGEQLCRQNAVEDTVYILLTGEVEIIENVKDDKISLGRLRQGDIVGEIGALFSLPRIANVTATKPSVVLEVSARDFSKLLNDTPILQGAVYQRLYERSLKTAMQSMPVFSQQDNASMPELSRVLKCWGSKYLN
ncbi:MAG: cyclic nucleotide-binding domain-containing protein [Gammaproteobacteria bacterium]